MIDLELQRAAEQGNAGAQYRLGGIYYDRRAYNEALHWFRMASGQGNVDAHYQLGRMYDLAIGGPYNPVNAAALFRQAAEQGHAEAQFQVGMKYFYEADGVPKDLSQAAVWLIKAYEQGHKEARDYLPEVWFTLAKQGDAEAQCRVGEIYHEGRYGVPIDNNKALHWYRMAAEQGNSEAQFRLGEIFLHGEGAEEDSAEAFRWYRIAAQKGLAAAQHRLGLMYRHGYGLVKDESEALKWTKMAAEKGNPDAQVLLGLMYRDGDGVPMDVAKAVELYRMAAEQGDDDAQFRLGIIYEGGQGVPKDLSAAAEWFRKAADRGHIEAGAGLREVLSEMEREKNAHNEDAEDEGEEETAQGLRYPGVACNYALIRFLPYPDSEEFVNIGIVLSCPKTGYFNARLEQQQFSRISTLFPEIKREVIQNVIDCFAKEMERFCVKISSHSDAQEQLPRKQELSRHFFSEVVRPRESVVRCSEPRTGMAEEPEALLDALFERYVERLHAQEELGRNEDTEDEGEEEIQSYRTKL